MKKTLSKVISLVLMIIMISSSMSVFAKDKEGYSVRYVKEIPKGMEVLKFNTQKEADEFFATLSKEISNFQLTDKDLVDDKNGIKKNGQNNSIGIAGVGDKVTTSKRFQKRIVASLNTYLNLYVKYTYVDAADPYGRAFVSIDEVSSYISGGTAFQNYTEYDAYVNYMKTYLAKCTAVGQFEYAVDVKGKISIYTIDTEISAEFRP